MLESLPPGVHDELLCTLPDTTTLLNAVLSCKTLHYAYSLRKKSIIQEVVKNKAGPASQYALAVARAMIRMKCAKKHGDWYRLRLGIEEDGNGNEGEFWCEEISVEDNLALETFEVVSTAEALEKEYSLRCAIIIFTERTTPHYTQI